MKLLKSFGKPKRPKLLLRRVNGNSMAPALRPGKVVLAVMSIRQLQPGDVVIVQHGGLEKIKRIAAIHAGRLYVVGDNQAASTDSRTFGWLPLSSVQGRVVWPRVRLD